MTKAPSRPRNSPLKLVVVSLIIVGSIAGTMYGLKKYRTNKDEKAAAAGVWQEMPEMVTMATAASVDYQPSVTAIGTIVASRSVSVMNELAGTIRQISLTPGSVVEQGQTLVKLDTAVEEAELASAKARLLLTDQMLQRQIKALEAMAAAQMELDRAHAERDEASANVDRVTAIIDRKSMLAPFKARVGINDVQAGQYLAEGTLIATLQALDGFVYVDFSLTQNNALGIAAGQNVSVVLPTGQTVRAPIVAVNTEAERSTRNLTFRVKLEDPQNMLHPGTSLRVTVDRGQARQLIGVPVSAIRRSPQGEHVFIVQADPKGGTRVKVMPVQSGPTVGEQTLLLGGLQGGERVIASGSFKLREGSLVADASAPPPGAAPAPAPPAGTAATTPAAKSSTPAGEPETPGKSASAGSTSPKSNNGG